MYKFQGPHCTGTMFRENREDGLIHSLSGKTHRILKFVKTQGILFTQVVNSLILKIKDIAIFAVKISMSFQKVDRSTKSVLCM